MRHRRKRSMIKRPTRWIDGLSTPAGDNVGIETFAPLLPRPGTASPPFFSWTELLNGDSDLEYADKSEVTIERVVGDISVLSTQFFLEFSEATMGAIRFNVRMGMLVVKEVEDLTTWVAPDMWDDEAIESAEWMWLKLFHMQPQFITSDHADFGGNAVRFDCAESMHMDVHVRRKLGKRDHLVMVAQWASTLAPGGDLVFGWNHMLRILVKA